MKDAEPHQGALLKKMADAGKAETDRFAKGQAVEKDIADLLEHHRMKLLELGAAPRLLVRGELQQVLPLDNAALLDAAKPMLMNAEVVPDSVAKAARQDAIKSALVGGGRGLPGGSSLARLPAQRRGVRNQAALPALTVDWIVAWAKASWATWRMANARVGCG
jgi:hypothetical protein